MADFLTVVVAAAAAQLAVLPGEKVQFIIAGLSTHYRPAVVIGAAGLAFAGWTALEIWLGTALKGALPPVYLDALSGVLFLLFGVLLIRSMPAGDSLREPVEGTTPETDGGMAGFEDGDGEGLDVSIAGVSVPDRYGSFLPIFVLMAVGEFGDKTQLITISLAVQYGAHPGIWVGEMLAIIPVSIANAYFFNRFSEQFNARVAHLVGAVIFLFFGLDTFLAVGTGFSVWETVVRGVADAVEPLLWVLVAAGPAVPV